MFEIINWLIDIGSKYQYFLNKFEVRIIDKILDQLN